MTKPQDYSVLRWLLLCLFACQATASAAEPALKRVPPQEPAVAVKLFETQRGFRMELVASEPLVTDPVAAAFDENGLLYVAEMIDYPIPPDKGRAPLGRVRVLLDGNGDGVYEQSWIFADEICWPTGVAPWKRGVFVAAAPDIWYLEDTDGDHRADIRELVFTGFGPQNQQGTVNNLAWAFDNKIYGSASTNGGQIKPGGKSHAKAISVNGMDFRFDPATRVFETVSGREQFGNAFDDWGNRFICSESNPITHVVLPQEYLARNPYLAVPSALNDLSPGVTPIFRTSPIEAWRAIRSSRRLAAGERKATSAGLSHEVIDAAAGLAIYRGDAFGDEYRGNLFIGCSQNNLVHRRQIIPQGASFVSRRADENTEFARTTDIWFRPVNTINAPDGTLYILDMSREVIEAIHIPLDVVAQLDLTSGRDRGRIYRLAPPGFHAPPPPRLGTMSTAELVGQLERRNGWTRDTAQRLLYQTQDRAALAPLRTLLAESKLPEARFHALWTLAGLGGLEDRDRLMALDDSAGGVREHAVRLSERRLNQSPALLERVLELADDAEPRVRFQVAFSLGYADDPRAIGALAKIARHDAEDPWTTAAVLTSSNETAPKLLAALLSDQAFESSGGGRALLKQLAAIVGARRQAAEIDRISLALGAVDDRAFQGELFCGLVEAIRRSGDSAPLLSPQFDSPTKGLFERLRSAARQTAPDPQRSVGDRQLAVRLLSFASLSEVGPIFAELLAQRDNESLALSAVKALAEFHEPAAGVILLGGWQSAGPRLRDEILRAVLARPAWTEELLSAIAREEIGVDEIAPSRRAELMETETAEIKSRARALFGATESARADVVARYQPALQLTGDSSRGDKVYERECTTCHRLAERGFQVGPNLALTRNRTPEQLLVHILDPNRDVQPVFMQYVVIDRDGRSLSGIVTEETANSITLGREKGAVETILKSNLDEIRSTSRSLMPDGFEKTIDPQAMADLIAFLQSVQYDIGTIPGEEIPGQVTQ